jgi:hypothetical protein
VHSTRLANQQQRNGQETRVSVIGESCILIPNFLQPHVPHPTQSTQVIQLLNRSINHISSQAQELSTTLSSDPKSHSPQWSNQQPAAAALTVASAPRKRHAHAANSPPCTASATRKPPRTQSRELDVRAVSTLAYCFLSENWRLLLVLPYTLAPSPLSVAPSTHWCSCSESMRPGTLTILPLLQEPAQPANAPATAHPPRTQLQAETHAPAASVVREVAPARKPLMVDCILMRWTLPARHNRRISCQPETKGVLTAVTIRMGTLWVIRWQALGDK